MGLCDNCYVEVTLQHLEAGSQLRLVRRQVECGVDQLAAVAQLLRLLCQGESKEQILMRYTSRVCQLGTILLRCLDSNASSERRNGFTAPRRSPAQY